MNQTSELPRDARGEDGVVKVYEAKSAATKAAL